MKTQGCDPRTFVGDGGEINFHGGSIVASNETGVAAAEMIAVHMSLMSSNDGQDGICGESGADGGGDWDVIVKCFWCTSLNVSFWYGPLVMVVIF